MSEWALPGKQPGGNHAPEPCYHRPRADDEVIEGVQQTGQASAGEDDPGGGARRAVGTSARGSWAPATGLALLPAAHGTRGLPPSVAWLADAAAGQSGPSAPP